METDADWKRLYALGKMVACYAPSKEKSSSPWLSPDVNSRETYIGRPCDRLKQFRSDDYHLRHLKKTRNIKINQSISDFFLLFLSASASSPRTVQTRRREEKKEPTKPTEQQKEINNVCVWRCWVPNRQDGFVQSRREGNDHRRSSKDMRAYRCFVFFVDLDALVRFTGDQSTTTVIEGHRVDAHFRVDRTGLRNRLQTLEVIACFPIPEVQRAIVG